MCTLRIQARYLARVPILISFVLYIALRLLQDANPFIPSSGDEVTVTCRALQQGRPVEFRAKREMIVSAGVRSSQLLQVSGIQNTRIGEQLVDAIGLEVFFSSPAQDNVAGAGNGGYPASFYSYLPDSAGRRAYHLVGKYGVIPLTMTVGVIFVLPVSRGYSYLYSKDPLQQPKVSFNILGSESDMNAMIYALREIILPMATALEAADPNYVLLLPDAATINDDVLIREFILNSIDLPSTGTMCEDNLLIICIVHNYCGGNSRAVNKYGQVCNTQKLRVVDASIVPFMDAGGMELSYVVGDVVSKHMLGKID